MEYKHTQGEWKIVLAPTQVVCDAQIICSVNDYAMMHGEHLANARLIAAAPELLEALEGMQKAFKYLAEKYEPDSNIHEWLIYSTEAIAKAKGEA